MQRLIYLTITVIALCFSVCSCEVQESSSKKDTAEIVPSTDNQVLKQISRRVMRGSDEIGKEEETKQYTGDGSLQYYTKFDYEKFDKEQKNGVITSSIYKDEAGKSKVGTAVYTFDKAKKTMLMELFCEGEKTPDAAEYFEYLDENFTWYTKFCQYLPADGNKITYYRTAVFAQDTNDYTEETDYVTVGLKWDVTKCEPVGELKILEKVTCTYNNTVIPGSSEKQHQWVKEVREVNYYDVTTGEILSGRKFEYDFMWNMNICNNNHVQQDSFELDMDNGNIISINDIVRKSFQKYGDEYKLKRKTWISAEGENEYYYEYEYALAPGSETNYYLTSQKWIDKFEGEEIIKSETKYLQYKDDKGDLIYEEIKLQADTSRGMSINSYGVSLMPKRYARGR